MVELEIEMRPDAPQIRKALGQLSAIDMREPFGEMVQDVVDAQDEAFGSSGAGSWPPLARAYAVRKAEAFPGRGLLERTGRMRANLRGGGMRRQVGERELRVELRDPKVAYHQYGTSRMPARPVFDIAAVMPRWTRRIEEHFAQVVRRMAAAIGKR